MEIENITEEEKIYSTLKNINIKNIKLEEIGLLIFIFNIILNTRSLAMFIQEDKFIAEGPIYEPTPIEIMDEVNPLLRTSLFIILVFDVIGYIIVGKRSKNDLNNINLKKRMKLLKIASIILFIILIISFIISAIW